jgi:hypothetical protein
VTRFPDSKGFRFTVYIRPIRGKEKDLSSRCVSSVESNLSGGPFLWASFFIARTILKQKT